MAKGPIIEDVALEPFSISVEKYCYAISEKSLTTKKDGSVEERKKEVVFPRTIEQALGWIVREKTRRRMAGAVSLRDFTDKLIQEARDVKSILDHV